MSGKAEAIKLEWGLMPRESIITTHIGPYIVEIAGHRVTIDPGDTLTFVHYGEQFTISYPLPCSIKLD